jgi:bacteriocin-like protein
MSDKTKRMVDPKAHTPTDDELSEEQLEQVTGGTAGVFLQMAKMDTTGSSATVGAGQPVLKSGQVTPL